MLRRILRFFGFKGQDRSLEQKLYQGLLSAKEGNNSLKWGDSHSDY